MWWLGVCNLIGVLPSTLQLPHQGNVALGYASLRKADHRFVSG